MFGRQKPMPALPETPKALAKMIEPSTIHDLSIAQLRALQTEIAALLAQKEAQARLDFKRDFVDRMSELGITIDDLKPEKLKKERKKRDLPVKYRDPEDPDNTWSGIGKPKRWLQEKLDQGYTLDQFAVSRDAGGESV